MRFDSYSRRYCCPLLALFHADRTILHTFGQTQIGQQVTGVYPPQNERDPRLPKFADPMLIVGGGP